MLQKKKKNYVVSLVETHLLRLKAREIDLKARDNARKEQEGQERLDLDKMKAMMNQEIQEAKASTATKN